MRRRGARRWALPVVVGLVGVASGAVAAAAGGIPANDAVQLIGYATLGAAIAGAIAALVGTALRRTNVGVQAAVAALAPVVATGIGVAWASARMFLMAHDLWVLAVVLCSASGVGVIVSILLGRRVSVAVRSVGAMARRLGEAGPSMDLAATGRSGGVPGELAALAGELQLTSTRLAEAQEQASALERSRRELVAWVSHDLRTPLAGIRAMVEALEDGVVDDPENIARYHRTIRQEADRLAGLVNDLFELSRIQAGSLALRYEAVPLDALVADAISGAAVAAGTKGIEVRTQMRTAAPSTVELSTPEMARVVRNLLDNAIRHTPPGERSSSTWGSTRATPPRWCRSSTAVGGSPKSTSTGSSRWPSRATPPGPPVRAAASGWRSPGGWSRPTRETSPSTTRGPVAASWCDSRSATPDRPTLRPCR